MARVFKPTYPKMRTVKGSDGKPVKVERVAKRGKNAGKKIMVVLREPVLGRNSKPVLVESPKWYVEYRTVEDTVRRVPGYTDKKATEQLAARLDREAAQKREGIIDKYAEHRKTPLSRHLEAYEEHQRNIDSSEHHIRGILSQIRKTLVGCHAVYWADLRPSSVSAFLAQLRRAGLGVQTSNYYLRAIKAFCQWLVKDGRFPDNPMAHVQGGNPNRDRRHDRRSLETGELILLLGHTRSAPKHHGMSGPERAMVYELAVESGLRVREIESLTPASFHLGDDPPTVTVSAAYSKHQREDIQPIRPEFAQSLREFLADREDGESLFSFSGKAARMIRMDLASARESWLAEAGTEQAREDRQRSDFLAYRDHSNRVADFHSLRHTFISNLANGGVHPKDAQSLARHSTITLTMDRYTHTARGKLATPLEALPD
ncbi:MAG: tyrosine-type recombinase/integrase, partial [Planctomycetes bacterium]|nr:tyrosine-type recombinase/integrase [Planctomycetota bacterium]